MTLDDVFAALAGRDAILVVQDDGLRYIGPAPLAPDDPLRAGIAEHRALLIEMFTYAPGGRCVFRDCYRLVAPGDKIACPDHREDLEATPMTSWTKERARILAAHPTTAATPVNAVDIAEEDAEAVCCDDERPCCEHGGVCSDQQHPHFDIDEWIDAMRQEQTDRYLAFGYGLWGAA